jgi:hypothetical protein
VKGTHREPLIYFVEKMAAAMALEMLAIELWWVLIIGIWRKGN